MLNYQFEIKIGRYANGARRLIVYLRRSNERQANGIYDQLDWAINRAAQLGLQLNATREDLDYMVANRLHQYKDIYLDSGIKGGFRTGGRAPYGFRRVLVNERGEVELELEDGMKVKKPGCHVQLRVGDPLKIAVWLEVLRMYGVLDWGLQRIAGDLNKRGIPPIAFGRKRKDGKPINRSGLWCESSVGYLIDHAAIIAVAEFGRETSGRHRRLSENGARELNEAERDVNGAPIRRVNPCELVIQAEGGYESLADRDLFEICRQKRLARRIEQANLRRAKDPAEFPLAGGLMIDANCGSSMHGQHKKSVYICGTYNKWRDAHGQKIADRCHHNTIDSEASLRFTMSALRQINSQAGGREKVEQKLRELHTESNVQHERSRLSQANFERLEREVAELQSQLTTAEENLAFEKDPKRRDGVGRVFDRTSNELEAKQAELEEARRTLPATDETDVETKVAAALAMYDRFDQIIQTKPLSRDLRIELQPMLKSLGFKLTCRFGSKLKGDRRVRALLAGTMTLGNRPVDPGNEVSNDSNGPVGPTGLPDPDEDSGKEKSLTPKTSISSGMGHNVRPISGGPHTRLRTKEYQTGPSMQRVVIELQTAKLLP